MPGSRAAAGRESRLDGSVQWFRGSGVTRSVVVLSTAGSRAEAERIATTLVEERLAACVNVMGPLASIYRWKGTVERAREDLLVIKTRRALVTRLIARLGSLHSYEVPEAIVLPIVAGARPYLAWLATETAPPAAARRRARVPARKRR
jgi:periplasmic divalent cation tolerance protein